MANLIKFFLIFLVIVGYGWWSYPDDYLRIILCDVGQGDAILIQRHFWQMIVDGGQDKSVLSCLAKHKPFWDKNIEMVIITHPQADHLNGTVEVVKRFEVELLIANAIDNPELDADNQLNTLIANKKIQMFIPKQGDQFIIEDISIDILWPENRVFSEDFIKDDGIIRYQNRYFADHLLLDVTDPKLVKDLNEISVVARLEYRDFKLLLTGDIGHKEEQALIDQGLLTSVEVLKVAHHGSKNSSSLGYLRIIAPEVSLISAGKNNRHGHPAKETLERLRKINTQVLRTDLEGDVVIVTDGKKYWRE